MLKSVFGIISKYVLDICEKTGLVTAKLALRFAKFAKGVYSDLKLKFIDFAKRWGKTFRSCRDFVGSVVSDIIRRTKRNAEKYGKLSGFYKFVEEIIKNTVRNKQFVFKAFNYTAPFIAVVIVFCIATSFNNVTLAYEVKCEGETIGYISDENVYSQASDIVKVQVEGSAELSTKPVLNVTLVSNDKLSTADDLSEKIIENSGELTEGYGLYVNEKFVLAAKDKSLIEEMLTEVKSEAKARTKADSAEFVDTVSINSGLYCDIQLMDSARIKSRLTTDGVLPIKTVRTETKTEVLKYETITANDKTKFEGYKKITVKGSNGEMKNTVETVYIDGEVQSTKTLSSTVTKAAIDEQVIVGTRKPENNISINSSAKYSWPVARVSSSYVSQYYGQGGHTGLDIAAYRGTQIYASAAGTVTEVVYSNRSYGNRFKVDCGNGIVMLYAHCDTMEVKVGDKVNMGQPVATVGSTGNSTGPHLHFEVIKNGVQVNPASYVGLS